MKTKIRRCLHLLPGLLFGLLLAISVLPQTAYAALVDPTTGSSTTATSSFDTSVNQHIDRSTILYDGQYYFDSKIDDNYNYKDQGDNDGCQDYIDHLTDGNAHATLHVRTKNPVNGGCDDKKSTITLQHTERSNMPFDYIDKNTITTSDQQTTYTYNDQLKEFLENGGDQCKDSIKVTAGPSDSGATLEVTASTGGNNTPYDNWDSPSFDFSNSKDGGNGCTNYGPNKFTASTVYLNNNSILQASPAASASSGSSVDNSAASGSPDVDCGGLSLNWIVCPIELGLQKAVSGIDGIINNLLEVNTDSIFSNCAIGATSTNCKTSNAYKQAWSSMRTIALALLVVGVLVMIISQAAGFDFVDAYTIRKVLPRVIVAAIGITLSWLLLKFFVSFANDVGNSIRALIYAPFSSLSHDIHPGWAGGLGLGVLTLAGTILLGFGLLSFLGTALLAVLLAVLVLIIRQVLIVFLIIIAPIAIVSYILPNTKKVYDIWWDFFAKALMMFPFIAAFIATGRVFAQVATEQAKSSASGGLTSQVYGILAFVSYFAPYFLLPLTLRFAGGALGTIGGFVNDRSKGGFDRLRQYRANRMKDRYQRASSGKLWDANFGRFGSKGRSIGGIASKAAMWSVNPTQNAGYELGKRGTPGLKKYSARIQDSIEDTTMEQSDKLFQHLNSTGMFNDKGYRALAGLYSGFGRETQAKLFDAGFIDKEGKTVRAPSSLKDIESLSHILSQSDNETERIAGNALEGSKGYLASLTGDAETMRSSIQAAGAFGLAAHGFAEPDDIVDVANMIGGGGKNTAFAQKVGMKASVYGQSQRPDIKAGYGLLMGDDGKTFVAGVRDPKRSRELLKTIKQQDWLGAKSGAVKNLHNHIRDFANERDANGGLTLEAQSMRDHIMQGASMFSSSDVDAKAEWKRIAGELNLDTTAYDQAMANNPALRASSSSGSGSSEGGTGGSGGGGSGGGGGGGGAA